MIVWSSGSSKKIKLRIFRSRFVAILTDGLDSMTLTQPYLHGTDGIYFRLLRTILGIKGSFYSKPTRMRVWERASFPERPSDALKYAQYHKLMDICSADGNNLHTQEYLGQHLKIASYLKDAGEECLHPAGLTPRQKRYFPSYFTPDALKTSVELAPQHTLHERAGH